MLGPIRKELRGFGAKAVTTELLVKGESTERPANMPAEFFHPTARSRLCEIAGKILGQIIREATRFALRLSKLFEVIFAMVFDVLP